MVNHTNATNPNASFSELQNTIKVSIVFQSTKFKKPLLSVGAVILKLTLPMLSL